MRKFLVFLSVLVSTIVSAQQIPNSLIGSNGVFIGFWEYKPVDYAANPTTRYPVIIFLHGIGEKGNGTTELSKVSSIAMPRMIANGTPMKFFWNGKWETFIVLSPQLSNAYGDWATFYVDEMIKHATTTLRGDPNRVFLTGLSLGGGAVWRIGAALAPKLAGIAPVCPTCQGVNWQTIASANLPVWTFHAKDDGVASWGCSQNPVNAINSYNPAVKAKITLWPTGNHWIWDRAYDPNYDWQSPNLYEWFLGQNKLSPWNAAPVANAGADVTIGPGGSATLNASSSYDSDGGIVRYVWKKISGPGGGELGSPSNATTSVTGMWNIGIYEYELTVADSRAVTSTDRVVINVVSGGSTTPPPPPTTTNQAPVARAGNDATITLPTNSANLNGGNSSDADGSIIKYEWKQISGPNTAGIAPVNGVVTQVTGLVQGTYTFRLSIWDDKYMPATDDVVITVNAGSVVTNQPPVARAGNDATITLPTNSTTLNASTSSDADGSIVKYEWKQMSGPSTAGIASVNGVSTNVTSLVQGTYTFRVTIWDDKYEPASDDVVVTVNAAAVATNQAPVARAGSDASVSGTSTTLNGSTSSDADGSIIKYQWTQVSGPSTSTIASVNGASTGVSALVPGTYTFRLTIWDNKYEPASDDVVITVTAATVTNQAPVARAGNDASVSGTSTTLNGSASSDADGSIIKYQWNQVSGPSTASIASVNGSSTGVSALIAGTYTFRLTIWDNKWEPASDDVVITVTSVTAANQAPVARAGSDASITLPTNSVTLNGSASSDVDGSIIKYQWTQVSGPSASSIASVNGSSTGVSGLVQGTYYFRLTIWDNKYEPASDDVMIEVKASTTAPPPATGNIAPVAKAGNDISIALPTSSVNLSGGGSYDPDGTINKYEWRQVSGPSSAIITSINNPSTSVTGLIQGSYTFALRIWDNLWMPSEDLVVITVNAAVTAPVPPGNQTPVAKAGNDVSLTLPTNWVKLNGGGSYDVDGSIIQYEWRKESGPASFLITNGNTATPIISNMVAGTYTYVLKVWDNQWIPTEDRIVITVNSTATGMASTFNATEASTAIVEEPLTVSPNPAVSYIVLKMVSATMGSTIVNIYDVNGRVVKQATYNKSASLFQQQIDISNLQAGTYTAEVIINNTKKSSTKFIKQ